MRKFDYKSLIFNLFIPIGLALIISMLIGDFSSFYDSLIRPIKVPSIIFPIVWFILYLTMGLAAYFIEQNVLESSKYAYRAYFIQLFVNLLWSVFFFGFELILFSAIWLLLLIVLVIYTMYLFYPINKTSFYLMIPYLLWIIFAAILNISIYIANV